MNNTAISILFFCLITPFIHAQNSMKEEIPVGICEEIYHKIQTTPKNEMAKRIDLISAQFLGQPYVLGALGEGKQATYDQTPLFRFDGFDCETFVTTVSAFALADNPDQYPACLKRLRYKDGKVSFIARNHFTGLDWNGNNQKQGYVRDITTSILDKSHQPVFKMAMATIDKPAWYQRFTVNNIRLKNPNKAEQEKRLQRLQKKAMNLEITDEKVPYLPLTALFNTKGEPNDFLFSQIPDGSIIEIVRPNWDLSKEIGTHLNVSHLGFALWKNHQLIFRQASSQYNKVVDVSLIEYLREQMKSPTIKGINVQIIEKNPPACA